MISLEAILQLQLHDQTLVFQTDTVYGLACKLHSKTGVEKIIRLKHRDQDKPLAVLCGDIETAMTLFKDPTQIAPLANKHWPGALTLVAKKSAAVPDFVTGHKDTVGVRIPNDPVALAILKRFGPLVATSLNDAGSPPVVRFEEALTYQDAVDYLVKGNDLSSVSSTVYDVESKRILRQGDVVID